MDFVPGDPVGHAPLPSRVLAGRSRQVPAVPSGTELRCSRALAAPGASAATKGKGAPTIRKCSWSKGTTKVGESAKSHLAWKSVMLVPDFLYEHRIERKTEEGEREKRGGRKKKEDRRGKERKRRKESRGKERKGKRKGKRSPAVVPASVQPMECTGSWGCGHSWLLATSGPTLVLQTELIEKQNIFRSFF